MRWKWTRISGIRPEHWVISCQVLVLIALGLGLRFAIHTSGGTVFLFSTVAPALMVAAIAVVTALAVSTYRKRHSMFNFEILQPGQTVFREGDEGNCAYFIQSGEVEILRRHEGQDRLLGRLGVGDYFGEVSLLTDQPRNATVRALVETHVSVVGKENFRNMLISVGSVREDILEKARHRTPPTTDSPHS